MEIWQWALSAAIALISAAVAVGGIVLVIMGRDRSLIQFIGQGKAESMAAVEAAKDDLRIFANAGLDAAHARINRFRDEYVRRDDFAAHERRVEKVLDEMKALQNRMHEQNAGDLKDIKQMINSSFRDLGGGLK